MARNIAKRANRPNPREDRNNNRVPHLSVVDDDTQYSKAKKIELLPRNIHQERYIDLLENESKDIVFAVGPAGTGKSYIATLYALRELRAGNIKKLIITRPAVSTDESHGYLPGSLTEKLAPWCRPILDILKEFYPVAVVDRMIADEIIELAPLGFLRGRTFKDAIVILDEAQNSTINQMKMVLTRIGDGSRIFVTGDIAQCENGYYEKNGLRDFANKLSAVKSDRISMTEFTHEDIERHPVITEILHLYNNSEEE